MVAYDRWCAVVGGGMVVCGGRRVKCDRAGVR